MSDSFAHQRPEHHVHSEEQPLPGIAGQPQAVDYSADRVEHLADPAGGWDQGDATGVRKPHAAEHHAPPHYWHEPPHHDAPPHRAEETDGGGAKDGANAFTEERPLGVQPTREGGVAIDGQDGLPEGKAKLTDKIVGKTEKVLGKLTHKPELHEKGELRETGGKAAAQGTARAAHD